MHVYVHTDITHIVYRYTPGSIDEGEFPGLNDSLYCRVCWVYGQDWSITAGQEEGLSQVSICKPQITLIFTLLRIKIIHIGLNDNI